MKKLSQKEIEANWQAMKDFLKICDIEVDNGSTMLFNAHGAYINKSKGTTDDIPSSNMSYAVNKYGSMSLSIPALDETRCFTEISTDFSRFKFVNGMLIITGEDSWHTGKGDYEVYLLPDNSDGMD